MRLKNKSMSKPELSIVIPVYNSARIFPELHRRISESIGREVPNHEIIAVLDGCKDNSFEVISGFHEKDPRVKLMEFSRNFGHQAAVSAGLQNASGAMVAIIDDDLEDPPEALLSLINKIKDGYDVVYGIRKKRKRSLFNRLLYSMFYRILGSLVDTKMPYDAGDFCVMRDSVVEILNRMPERNRYLRGLRAWSGFRQTGVEYEREQRFANTPGYSLAKYIALALDAVFSFSNKPLKYVSYCGAFVSMAGFMYGAMIIHGKLAGKVDDIRGWSSTLATILFFSGAQMISLGIIGEYIARIYDEVKQRPKYLVMRSMGFDPKAK